VSTGPQRSSILRSVADADALVCLVRAEGTNVKARAGTLAYAILLTNIGHRDALCPAPAVLLHDEMPRVHETESAQTSHLSTSEAAVISGAEQRRDHPDQPVDEHAQLERIKATAFMELVDHLKSVNTFVVACARLLRLFS